MTSEPENIYVFIFLEGATQAVPAGELTLNEVGSPRIISSEFVYGTRYIRRSNAIELDPLSLKFKGQEIAPGERLRPTNNLELFGVFRDASPDAWGRRVIENKLKAPPQGLPESVYIREAGTNRTGALDFRDSPTASPNASTLIEIGELHHLLDAARRIEEGLPVPANLERYLDPGTSLGGARPKANIVADGRMWLAKFPARDDRFNVPRIEYATLQLAREAGLDVPQIRMESLDHGREVLMVERFDRISKGNDYLRRHFISGLTILGLHESESPNSSYLQLVEAIRRYGSIGTLDEQCKELFGRMIFNILASNNDDHLRNHGFLWSQNGYILSPLYDVLPTPQVAMERYLHLGIGDQGRHATLVNAMTKHEAFNLSRERALEIIDRIARVTRQWKEYFKRFGVSNTDVDKIATAFRNPHDIGGDAVFKVGKPEKRVRATASK